ncbi:hypothetical protein [Streptomyces shenzhenensis]|uniref:Uncharacterized protein n=1 Tax=Streptomyces shenzhenensis TaxID=943815 RepID=A0A3M0I1H8_9ACTN|nr:hypothetical protein [Streptomyces shenzhenensis]RMB82298.1 hypothetical protein CTZ28_29585 [Streptomyces shenzhenensis]
MRWLTLYARSRQVPASLAAVVIVTALGWAFAREGSDNLRLPLLIVGAGVMAASTGLSGQDFALDRTAAIRWLPRRAAHVLLAGVMVGTVLMTAQAISAQMVPVELVVRNCAGLMGLAALGAVVLGGPYAWSLPFAWLAFALFTPPATSVSMEVATWMLLPPDTAAGTWTALVLSVLGTTAYAVAGPKR